MDAGVMDEVAEGGVGCGLKQGGWVGFWNVDGGMRYSWSSDLPRYGNST